MRAASRSLALRFALASLVVLPAAAQANPPCGAVEFRFAPGAPDLQIVVWVEESSGKHVATPYITRLTGQFGIGNRPGSALLKTNFRWPYGRREMVLPIWAHHRDHHYPKLVMGGACQGLKANSPDSPCGGGGTCSGDCVDTTIAYHARVSSYEPFFCSPSGPSAIDALSCASKGTFSKGAYLPFPQSYSLYPPRADIAAYDSYVDSPELLDFAKQNDLVAVSQATPPASAPLDPPLVWFPPSDLPEGDYTAWIELSQEYDFNAYHNHPNQPDSWPTWDFEGKPFLGQPSVVYKVPFHYAPGAWAITGSYAGYSTWDGSDGVLHPPDGTITADTPGSGAGRLLDMNDGVDVFRFKVLVGTCGDGGTCEVPQPVRNFKLTPHATSIDVSFDPSASGMPPSYAVRYREGNAPIADADFSAANAAPSVPAGTATRSVTITGLIPQKSYAVAVRANAPCGNEVSSVVSAVTITEEQKFVTLSGCFVATAAWGSELSTHVASLRRFRDEKLLTNPAGQLFVASYYAFSPSVARAIARDEGLRAAARWALAPIVRLVER